MALTLTLALAPTLALALAPTSACDLKQIAAAQRGCYFAFVDAVARRGHAQSLGGAESWTLLPLRGELPFGGNARRNSRIPKLLPHRLFPLAHFALWVDGEAPASTLRL